MTVLEVPANDSPRPLQDPRYSVGSCRGFRRGGCCSSGLKKCTPTPEGTLYLQGQAPLLNKPPCVGLEIAFLGGAALLSGAWIRRVFAEAPCQRLRIRRNVLRHNVRKELLSASSLFFVDLRLGRCCTCQKDVYSHLYITYTRVNPEILTHPLMGFGGCCRPLDRPGAGKSRVFDTSSRLELTRSYLCITLATPLPSCSYLVRIGAFTAIGSCC